MSEHPCTWGTCHVCGSSVSFVSPPQREQRRSTEPDESKRRAVIAEVVVFLRAVPEPKGSTPYEPTAAHYEYWIAQKFADTIEAEFGDVGTKVVPSDAEDEAQGLWLSMSAKRPRWSRRS